MKQGTGSGMGTGGAMGGGYDNTGLDNSGMRGDTGMGMTAGPGAGGQAHHHHHHHGHGLSLSHVASCLAAHVSSAALATSDVLTMHHKCAQTKICSLVTRSPLQLVLLSCA